MSAGTRTWLKLIADCLAAVERECRGSFSPVVDHEVVIDPQTQPEEVQVWCICRTAEDARMFTDTELGRYASALRRELLHAGFPESAIASLAIRALSRDELAARGGRLGRA